MIAVGHTSVGVIVGLAGASLLPMNWPLWGQVLVVGLCGVASHYLMDLVPHGHYEFDGRQPTTRSMNILRIDLLVPIVVVAIILLWRFGLGSTSWLVAAGIVGAQLPDVFDGLLTRGTMPPFRLALLEQRFHLGTHWHNPTVAAKATAQGGRRLDSSDVWQALVATLAIIFLLIT